MFEKHKKIKQAKIRKKRLQKKKKKKMVFNVKEKINVNFLLLFFSF